MLEPLGLTPSLTPSLTLTLHPYQADTAVLEPSEVPRKIPNEEPLPDGAPRPGWENLRVAVESPP